MSTFKYRWFGIPGNLEELLDKAKKEGEKKMHILTSYSTSRTHSGGSFYSLDVSIRVRYFHGREERETFVYNTSSKSCGYNANMRIEEIKDKIEKAGFEVATIRNKKRCEED